MNQTDHKKLIDAGYLIIRADDTNKPIIKARTADQFELHTLLMFHTKAERNRQMKILQSLSTTITD